MSKLLNVDFVKSTLNDILCQSVELKEVLDFGYITWIGLSFIAFCSEISSYKFTTYIPKKIYLKCEDFQG